jgi:DNA-binding NtrC family response regulator
MRETVCLLGNPYGERLSMDALAAESGWAFEHVGNLSQLQEIGVKRNIIAVLIDTGALGMPPNGALRAVTDVLPNALPILCHKASETIQWAELAQAGAFHALLLPLRASEVRQTLGFVSEAHRRRRSRLVVLHHRPRMRVHEAQVAGTRT